jgi:hypothetical protein
MPAAHLCESCEPTTTTGLGGTARGGGEAGFPFTGSRAACNPEPSRRDERGMGARAQLKNAVQPGGSLVYPEPQPRLGRMGLPHPHSVPKIIPRPERPSPPMPVSACAGRGKSG